MLKRKAYTIPELLVVVAIIAILFTCCVGVFVTLNLLYHGSIAEYNMQRSVNGVVARIVRGAKEHSGGTFGLRSSVSFSIPASSEIDFVGTDGNTRRCFLSGNSIVYDSPTQNPNQQNIYTAPAGAAITLRFWEPAGYIDHETAGVYMAVSQQMGNRSMSGSLSTYVNLRNMPK